MVCHANRFAACGSSYRYFSKLALDATAMGNKYVWVPNPAHKKGLPKEASFSASKWLTRLDQQL